MASFFGSTTMAKQSCGRIETNSIAIPFKHLDLILASCNADVLSVCRLAYNRIYWWKRRFFVPHDAYNGKNTTNIHTDWKKPMQLEPIMQLQFYSPVSMNPTMTFSWFLVENPGISHSALVDKPMKSHEWVVCSLLFVFGNTETTPGISAEMNIRLSISASQPSPLDSLGRVLHTHSKSHVWWNYRLIFWLALCSVWPQILGNCCCKCRHVMPVPSPSCGDEASTQATVYSSTGS